MYGIQRAYSIARERPKGRIASWERIYLEYDLKPFGSLRLHDARDFREQKICAKKNSDMKKQATRKRLGLHVSPTKLKERNSEGKIPSILGSRGKTGEGILGLKEEMGRWTKNFPSSSERGDICMESRGCNESEWKSLLNSNGRYECWRNYYRWPPRVGTYLGISK
jgi:hypothetical protein